MADCCGDNRFTLIERAKQDFIENTNISDTELAVLDRMCFRMWQLGLLKKYDDIDEDKLDEDSVQEMCEICGNIVGTSGDIEQTHILQAYKSGFKAGYRKAIEE